MLASLRELGAEAVWLMPYGKIKGAESEKRISNEDLAGRKRP
jgi:hypothetical protein